MLKALLLFLVSFKLYASSINLDIGQTADVFNRFAIPSSDANRISLDSDDTITSYRITGFHDIANDNQLYFLFAPLSTTYSFTSNKDFEFDGTSFANNTETEVYYKFNSYRLGYLWKWRNSSFDYWVGVVGKIRDAKIEVKQGSTKKEFSNIGFVPLAAFGAEWRILNALSIFTHTDALGAPQGSAYDSQIELKYQHGSYGASFGKRILGGGADNDTVYNFAQFDSLYLKLSFDY